MNLDNFKNYYQIVKIKLMNSRISKEELSQKINQCMDELSKLLDNIYQFPHRQRELYYERIQSLKQSLTVIKSSLKDTNISSHERKYQQLFLKVNQLKAQILSLEAVNRKRRPSVPLANSSNIIKNKDYDEVMELLVTKDEEVKKYRQLSHEYQNKLQEKDNSEETMREEIMQIRNQIVELNQLNLNIIQENEQLRKEVEEASKNNIHLQSLYTTHRQVIENSKLENQRVKIQLQETSKALKNKQAEAESLAIQLAALNEKYDYDRREYLSKEECYKVRQRSYEKQIKELTNDLDVRKDTDEKSRYLKVENLRLKEDIDVLQAEISILSQREIDRGSKMKLYEEQIITSMQELKSKSAENQSLMKKVDELTSTNSQLSYLKESVERRNSELQQKYAENEEQMMKDQKMIKELEKKNLVKEEIIKQNQDKVKGINKKIASMEAELNQEKKSCEVMALNVAKQKARSEEMSKMLEESFSEKRKSSHEKMNMENASKQQEEKIKLLMKEIEELKKRLLRAKIEAVHNLRELIL